VLENPQAGSSVSGISRVSGWKCTAGTLTVQFDANPPVLAAYGTSRKDTHSTCGQSHTGVGLPWNYNLLGDGQHTVTVFDNGGVVYLERADKSEGPVRSRHSVLKKETVSLTAGRPHRGGSQSQNVEAAVDAHGRHAAPAENKVTPCGMEAGRDLEREIGQDTRQALA
jgi:hypothetical protein